MGGFYLEKHYVMTIEDYSLPGFCSGTSKVIISRENLDKFIKNLPEDILQTDITEAYNEFVNGNVKAEYTVAYSKQRFLRPCKVIDNLKTEGRSFLYDHKNIYGYTYRVLSDDFIFEYITVKENGKEQTYLKPCFTNLRFDTEGPNKTKMLDNPENFWGFPGLFIKENDQIKSLVYFPVNLNEDTLEPCDFSEVFNAVFGDG